MNLSKAKFRAERRVRKAAALLARTWKADDSLPWRRNPSPYRIFLAEFLLVRTRWDVVARLFEAVVAHFPDLHTLAQASEERIAEVLAPLGLRKRIPYLKKAAVYLLEHHGGNIPETIEELKRVPGLGDYTAGAIAALAFGKKIVPADVNVFRFLSRLTGIPMTHPTKGSPHLRELLLHLSPAHGGPPVTVLIDFLRTTCRPRYPRCPECPLKSFCAFRELGQTSPFEVPSKSACNRPGKRWRNGVADLTPDRVQ